MRYIVLALLLCWCVDGRGEEASELLGKAQLAWSAGKQEQAIELVSKAIKDDPKNAKAFYLRGAMHEVRLEHAQAIADFTRTIELAPENALAYNHRGSEHFKLGHIDESVRDFDTFLKFRPKEMPGHWRRGISLYYAGKFKLGREQFEGYEAVDTNDVENAVWHFLCKARETNVQEARKALLKIGRDTRVPMMQVYALFGDKLKPADVLAAARAGKAHEDVQKRRLFYAHLYLGLYYEVLGDKSKAKEHIDLAAKKYRISHYMGDVANVHSQMLQKKEE